QRLERIGTRGAHECEKHRPLADRTGTVRTRALDRRHEVGVTAAPHLDEPGPRLDVALIGKERADTGATLDQDLEPALDEPRDRIRGQCHAPFARGGFLEHSNSHAVGLLGQVGGATPTDRPSVRWTFHGEDDSVAECLLAPLAPQCTSSGGLPWPMPTRSVVPWKSSFSSAGPSWWSSAHSWGSRIFL